MFRFKILREIYYAYSIHTQGFRCVCVVSVAVSERKVRYLDGSGGRGEVFTLWLWEHIMDLYLFTVSAARRVPD